MEEDSRLSTEADADVGPLTADLGSEDPVRRHEAARALGRYPAAITALIEALRHPDPVVREEAAFSLGRIGDRHAVEPLIAALRDPQAAAGAAHALVELGDDRAADDLLDCLDEREPLLVQSAALHAVARLGGRGIADRLIEVARDETRDPGVRLAAESEIRALDLEPAPRRVGLLPVWLVGMVTIAGALAVASVIGAPALVLLAIGAMLIAGGGIAASRGRA